MQIFGFLTTRFSRDSMEAHLYRKLCLLATGLTLGVILPANLIQGLPLFIDVAIVFYAGGTFALYLFARSGHLFLRSFLVLILATLNAIWFLNGGIDSSVIFYFFPALIYPLIFFRGRECRLLVALVALNAVLLMIAGHSFPELITPFPQASDRLIDLIAGFSTVVLGIGLMLGMVVQAHDNERRRLDVLNRELSEALQEKRDHAVALQQSLREIRTLQGLLPICAWCKKIRDERGDWQRVDEYIASHTDAEFTHSLCPDCFDEQSAKISPSSDRR